MNKFYLILFFIGLAFFAKAQPGKAVDTNESRFSSQNLQPKILKSYPNPAVEVINFEFYKPVQQELILQVYNFVGKKVYQSTNVSQKTSVQLTEFFRGVYIYQLRDKAGRIVESGKFQVSK